MSHSVDEQNPEYRKRAEPALRVLHKLYMQREALNLRKPADHSDHKLELVEGHIEETLFQLHDFFCEESSPLDLPRLSEKEASDLVQHLAEEAQQASFEMFEIMTPGERAQLNADKIVEPWTPDTPREAAKRKPPVSLPKRSLSMVERIHLEQMKAPLERLEALCLYEMFHQSSDFITPAEKDIIKMRIDSTVENMVAALSDDKPVPGAHDTPGLLTEAQAREWVTEQLSKCRTFARTKYHYLDYKTRDLMESDGLNKLPEAWVYDRDPRSVGSSFYEGRNRGGGGAAR